MNQELINLIDLKGYENVQETVPGDFAKLPPGGYICRVIHSELTLSKSGKSMLVLFVDIDVGDFKGFFKNAVARVKSFNSDIKWDNSAIYRQLVFGNDGNVSRFFKGLLSCFKSSNPDAFTFNPHAFDEKALRNLIIGFVFAEEEYCKRDGTIASRVFIKFPKTVEDIRNNNFSVPDVKRIAPPVTNDPHDDFSGSPVDTADLPF